MTNNPQPPGILGPSGQPVGQRPRQLDPRVIVFCIQELLKTPLVEKIVLVKIPVNVFYDPTGQQNQTISESEIERQEFTPEDLRQEKPINLNGIFQFHFIVHGAVPRPSMPAPGGLNLILSKMRTNVGLTPALPMVLHWLEFNIETFHYIAISQGPPMVEIAPPMHS